jgi:hypothetical protein
VSALSKVSLAPSTERNALDAINTSQPLSQPPVCTTRDRIVPLHAGEQERVSCTHGAMEASQKGCAVAHDRKQDSCGTQVLDVPQHDCEILPQKGDVATKPHKKKHAQNTTQRA